MADNAYVDRLADRARMVQRRLMSKGVPLEVNSKTDPQGNLHLNVNLSFEVHLLLLELLVDALDSGTIQSLDAERPTPTTRVD